MQEYQCINVLSRLLLRLTPIDTFHWVWLPLNHKQYASLYLTLPGIVHLTFPQSPQQLHRTEVHYSRGWDWVWCGLRNLSSSFHAPLVPLISLQYLCPHITCMSYIFPLIPTQLAMCLLCIGVVTWLRKRLVLLMTFTPPQWADSGTSRK